MLFRRGVGLGVDWLEWVRIMPLLWELTPFLNMLDILLAVLQRFSGCVLVRVEERLSRRFSWLQLVGP